MTRLGNWLRARRTRIGIVLAALVCVAGASLWVVPELRVEASPRFLATFPLDRTAPTEKERHAGTIDISGDGYVIRGQAAGEVRVPVRLRVPRSGRVFARIWAYAPGPVEVKADLLAADRTVHPLGRVGDWVAHDVDVTDAARLGPWALRVEADNPTEVPALFLDQLQIVSVPDGATPSASRLMATLWVALVIAALLAAAARLRRHWPLPVAAAILVFVAWPDVTRHALEPLDPTTAGLWRAARDASWFGLEKGLLSGTFTPLSAVAVQLLHALGAVTGFGLASGRTASLLLSVGSLSAVYALGTRVAGRIGAVTAVTILLLADPLREAATATAIPVLVLAGALLAYGVHCCIAEATPYAVGLLGGLGALAAMTDPVLVPGVIVAIAILSLARGAPGLRVRALGIGLLVFVLVLLPSRISLSAQNDGEMLADVRARATYARNFEFAGTKPGLPSREQLAQQPFGGPGTGMLDYVFGDHRLSVAAGSALRGADRAEGALAERPTTGFAGLAAFLLTLAGAGYVLLVRRLRLLVLVPLAALFFDFFLVGRGALEPVFVGALLSPCMLAAAGAFAYALSHAYVLPWYRRRSARVVPAEAQAPAGRRVEVRAPVEAPGRGG